MGNNAGGKLFFKALNQHLRVKIFAGTRICFPPNRTPVPTDSLPPVAPPNLCNFRAVLIQ